MASEKMKLLGIGEDPEEREAREGEYFALQANLELKKVKSEHRVEAFKRWSTAVREQWDEWGTTIIAKWPFSLYVIGATIAALLFVWLGSTVLVWAGEIITAPFGPWPTGYSVQVSTSQDSDLWVKWRDEGGEWRTYTPLLTPDQAQVQLEQLQSKYPKREWGLVQSDRHRQCFRVVRTYKFKEDDIVSPCFADYGAALATMSKWQMAEASGDPITVPEVTLYEPPKELPYIPEPQIVEKVVTKPVLQPPETTVVVVENLDDYWLPYAEESIDVTPEDVKDLMPDNVYYVVE